MKKFCTDLRKHQTEIANYEKEEMLPLTDEKNKSQKNKKFCHICRKKFHNASDRRDDSDNVGSNDDSNVDEEFDDIKCNDDAPGLDDADDDYYDNDNDSDDDFIPEYFMMVTQDLMMNTSCTKKHKRDKPRLTNILPCLFLLMNFFWAHMHASIGYIYGSDNWNNMPVYGCAMCFEECTMWYEGCTI